MVRTVLHYPDPRLKERSRPVTLFDESLHTLLDDMHETMIGREGIGLAAIQIGEPLQALVINLGTETGEQPPETKLEVINPKILEKRDTQKYREGCLSLPQFYEDVIRAAWVRVRYQDRYGQFQEIEADGLLAVALQHEMDHLAGILFYERLSIVKRKKFENEYASKFKPRKGGARRR
ncbi:MAG: peptide deformylase [Campylobacterales bacterium]